jgi:hypothetical protein
VRAGGERGCDPGKRAPTAQGDRRQAARHHCIALIE